MSTKQILDFVELKSVLKLGYTVVHAF